MFPGLDTGFYVLCNTVDL